ncbi:MAG: G5 domain-containing protein, partial [Firmicutes bacterium]|nr:G5 domain-containing protein [Bacillota bacterium]
MRAKHKGKSRLIVIAALGLVLALLVTMVPGRTQKAEESAPEAPAVQTAFVFAGSTTYYQVNVGTEAAAVFQTEQEAKEVIDQIKEKYVDPKATIVNVTVEPEVTVEKISVPKSDEQPEVATDVKAVVEELTSGEDKVETYTVKEGDTLWDIAAAEKVSVEEIQAENPDLDLDYIAVGDELIISTTPAAQAVNVTVEYEQVSEIAVPYEIIYEEDPEMYEDEINVVKTSGADGKAEVTERIVAVNGREASKKQIAKKEIAAPVAEVIAYGTLEREDATIAVDDADTAKKKEKKPEEQELEEEEESLAMTLELEEEEETAEETADEDEETYEEEPEEESYDEEETYEEEPEEETYEEESYEEETYEEEP